MSQMVQIHEQLREMILGLALAPGEKLTERWLEARFAGSRTPVRAALLRLEAEDLVRREGRGWMVAPIDLAELQALAEFREPLEREAVRLACQRALKADLDAITAMLDACQPESSREDWHRAGTEFHVALARLSGNPFIVKAIEGVMAKLSRARWLELWAEPARAQAWAEHRQIVAFIRQPDPQQAEEAAGAHVRHSSERLLQALNKERRFLRARGLTLVGAG